MHGHLRAQKTDDRHNPHIEPLAHFLLRSKNTCALWSTPIPAHDGCGVRVMLLVIVKDAMDYFRAVFQSNELSQRAFHLTSKVIDSNPANYTVW